MITPSYALTASTWPLPNMSLDFTTAVADARVTTTRANNTATRINSSGVFEIVNANLPRFDFDPVTLVCRGMLVEVARTNLFLNSLIDGTNLSTQSVTLSATAYVLSFYGAGSIAISGGHTATVNGTGAFPTRTTYSFTPTAGSTTFTITGAVKYAQLEDGPFATSFIPTAGTSVLRNADVVDMTGTNFSSWYNPTEGTIYAEYIPFTNNLAPRGVFSINDGTNSNSADWRPNGGDFLVVSGGATQADMYPGGVTPNTIGKGVLALKLNSMACARNGNAVLTDNIALMPVSPDRLNIGRLANSATFAICGWMRKIMYWPQRLTDAEVRAFSK